MNLLVKRYEDQNVNKFSIEHILAAIKKTFTNREIHDDTYDQSYNIFTYFWYIFLVSSILILLAAMVAYCYSYLCNKVCQNYTRCLRFWKKGNKVRSDFECTSICEEKPLKKMSLNDNYRTSGSRIVLKKYSPLRSENCNEEKSCKLEMFLQERKKLLDPMDVQRHTTLGCRNESELKKKLLLNTFLPSFGRPYAKSLPTFENHQISQYGINHNCGRFMNYESDEWVKDMLLKHVKINGTNTYYEQTVLNATPRKYVKRNMPSKINGIRRAKSARIMQTSMKPRIQKRYSSCIVSGENDAERKTRNISNIDRFTNKFTVNEHAGMNNDVTTKDQTHSRFAEDVQSAEPNLIKIGESLGYNSDESETYDELGMILSQFMKMQSRPCQRRYCILTRHLKRKRMHDTKHCQVKSKYHRMYVYDQRSGCNNGNVCEDTYDEFKLMRVSVSQRKSLYSNMVRRRKQFLNQPYLSSM